MSRRQLDLSLGFKVQVSTIVFEVMGLTYTEKGGGLKRVALGPSNA